jgi:hypothetical protein
VRPRPQTNTHIAFTALGAVLLALLVLGANVAFSSHYVARLTIRNPTPYDVDVEVSGNGRSWMPLGVAEDGASTAMEEIADQGGTWHFRLRAQGFNAGALTVTRAHLRADGWSLELPASIGNNLRTRGAPLPP